MGGGGRLFFHGARLHGCVHKCIIYRKRVVRGFCLDYEFVFHINRWFLHTLFMVESLFCIYDSLCVRFRENDDQLLTKSKIRVSRVIVD